LGNSSKKIAFRHAEHNSPGFPHRGAFVANRGKGIHTPSQECRRHERLLTAFFVGDWTIGLWFESTPKAASIRNVT